MWADDGGEVLHRQVLEHQKTRTTFHRSKILRGLGDGARRGKVGSHAVNGYRRGFLTELLARFLESSLRLEFTNLDTVNRRACLPRLLQ